MLTRTETERVVVAMNVMSSFLVGIILGLALFGLNSITGLYAGGLTLVLFTSFFDILQIVSYMVVGVAAMFIFSIIALVTIS